jgi:hypothetical protein
LAIKVSSAKRVIEEFGSLEGKPETVKALLFKKAYIYPFVNGQVRMCRVCEVAGSSSP